MRARNGDTITAIPLAVGDRVTVVGGHPRFPNVYRARVLFTEAPLEGFVWVHEHRWPVEGPATFGDGHVMLDQEGIEWARGHGGVDVDALKAAAVMA